MTFYAPFDLATYAHCFRCHNQDIVLVPETDRLTEFRDGRRNLHYLHVNRKPKGRTCRTCHETHASHQQRHIAEKVPFGRWSYPLKYEKTETGGSCFVGCHEKMGYDREDPLHENLHEKSERPAATERSTKEGGR